MRAPWARLRSSSSPSSPIALAPFRRVAGPILGPPPALGAAALLARQRYRRAVPDDKDFDAVVRQEAQRWLTVRTN
jgi:hypothetical protein